MADACRDDVAHREIAHFVTDRDDLADAAVPGVEGIPRVSLPVRSRVETTVEHGPFGPARHERVAGPQQHLRRTYIRNVEAFEHDPTALWEHDTSARSGVVGHFDAQPAFMAAAFSSSSR